MVALGQRFQRCFHQAQASETKTGVAANGGLNSKPAQNRLSASDALCRRNRIVPTKLTSESCSKTRSAIFPRSSRSRGVRCVRQGGPCRVPSRKNGMVRAIRRQRADLPAMGRTGGCERFCPAQAILFGASRCFRKESPKHPASGLCGRMRSANTTSEFFSDTAIRHSGIF